ncbi:hypothetical protein CPB83DRAFT_853510 [Crepidotus variabilis]|uniref:F-box domain-containing protein n=1 Tax=Crepidotus variabilis TaxID=179855 RepID=A0A9P6JPX0_9AGAR|nr:hypothetical protein CPB83DRAFT_853510 [Crepidotus variabilis]
MHRRLTNLMTALRRLPSETILEIFGHISPSDRASVLHVSQVCRLWRELATGTPSLWTDIYLPCPSRSNQENPTFDSMWGIFCLQFNRCQGKPLSLAFNDIPGPILERLLEQLFSQSNTYRFKSLSFQRFRAGNIKQVLNYYEAYRHEANSLLSLSLISPIRQSNPPPITISDLMALPALHTVNLTWCFLNFQVSEDWKHLTSLSMHVMGKSEEYLTFLPHCPNLVFLDMDVRPETDDIEFVSDKVVTLQHLKKFTLFSASQPSGLLDHLAAPNVEMITFDFPRGIDFDDLTPLWFLERVNGRLQELQLTGEVATNAFGEYSYASNSKNLPSLQNLKFFE